ncbi:MAG: TolC family protein [candidate division WOR-3 bacterium]
MKRERRANSWFLFLYLFGFRLLTADTLLLTLEKSIALALQNNRLISQTKAKIEEMVYQKGITFSSFLPQINLSGTFYRTDRINKFNLVAPRYENLPLPVVDPLTGETIGFTPPIPLIVGVDTLALELGARNNYLLRGTVQQTLFTWGKVWYAYRIAGLSLNLEKEGLKVVEGQVKVAVVEGFYQAFLAQKMVDLLLKSQEQLERHLSRVKMLYERGLANRLDLLKTEVKLAEVAVQVARMRNNAQMALASLCSTLGLDINTPVVLAAELEREDWSLSAEEAIQTALVKRPELSQLREAIKIVQLTKRIALTANLPTFFGQLNYDYKNPVGFEKRWGSDWNLTLGFTLPLFTGFSNLNKIKQAQAKERQAQLALKLAEEGIKLEVLSFVNALNQERENIIAQEKNLQVAREALSLAEKGYESGFVTNLDYLDSSLSLSQSEIAYWQSLANYQIIKAKLKRAIGEF